MGLFAKFFTRSKAESALPAAVPRHVAIIMDGNGRWAQRRGLPRSAGHRAGLERLEDIIAACIDLGIPYLTLYAFSTENWQRSPEEVDYLMRLFAQTFEERTKDLIKQGVRLRFIGRRDRLPVDIITSIEQSEKEAPAEVLLNLILAIDYGSRDEITHAMQRILDTTGAESLGILHIEESLIKNNLYTADLPDPDLVIRPGGECRLSNFLLWQAAYAELWFCQTLWPDFGREQFLEALRGYANRRRCYGRVP